MPHCFYCETTVVATHYGIYENIDSSVGNLQPIIRTLLGEIATEAKALYCETSTRTACARWKIGNIDTNPFLIYREKRHPFAVLYLKNGASLLLSRLCSTNYGNCTRIKCVGDCLHFRSRSERFVARARIGFGGDENTFFPRHIVQIARNGRPFSDRNVYHSRFSRIRGMFFYEIGFRRFILKCDLYLYALLGNRFAVVVEQRLVVKGGRGFAFKHYVP